MNEVVTTEPAGLWVLYVGDRQEEAGAVLDALHDGGFLPAWKGVSSEAALRTALQSRKWDVAVYGCPEASFSALEALAVIRGVAPDLPLIVFSESLSDREAMRLLLAGAHDCLDRSRPAQFAASVRKSLVLAHARQDHRRASEELARTEGRLRNIVEAMDDVIWSITLPSFEANYVSPAADRLFGESARILLRDQSSFLRLVHPDDSARMECYLQEVLEHGSSRAEFRIVRPTGEVRWLHARAHVVADSSGLPCRVDGITTDISARKRAEQLVYEQSHFDPLTGLPNRRMLCEKLDEMFRDGGERTERIAVLFADLDRFRAINDTLGHGVGDRVVAEMALRLKSVLGDEDLLARFGGDSFVIVLHDAVSEKLAEAKARQFLDATRPALMVEGREIRCGMSIGVALPPIHGSSSRDLLMNAEAAVYQAKGRGHNPVLFYDPAWRERGVKRLELEASLHRALERGELEVHYQPQADLKRDGAISGFEALARWRHPERGYIPPAEFIPVAEEAGMIHAIGNFVLHEACRTAKQWVERYDSNLAVAVNVSALEFNEDLAAQVAAILEETGLPARNLELELTESAVMRNAERSAQVMAELKAKGVSMTIDDFGSGYSSLAYLQRLPIDQVKIDRSFVSDITTNPDSAAICTSILALAHSLGLTVVAEGVEDDGQLAFLFRHGSDRIQGFLFERPMPACNAEALLREKRALRLRNDSSSSTRTLLLVDDEENILSALKRLLRRDGYRVFGTTDPNEAFELLARHPIGVIISDQRMPQMSGTELLRRVKDLYPDTVRMVLSGYTDLKSITDAINEGSIYRFLTKPWEDAQLRDAIREAFEQQELVAENRRLLSENRESSSQLAGLNTQLADLVREKLDRIARDEAAIGMTQEAFRHVPFPAIGVDDDGMVVLATKAAQKLVPTALPGSFVDGALMPAWAARETAPCCELKDAAGRRYCAEWNRLQVPAGAAGWLLTLLPGGPTEAVSAPELVAEKGGNESHLGQR